MGCGSVNKKENESPQPERKDLITHSEKNLNQEVAKEEKEEEEFINQMEMQNDQDDQQLSFEEIEYQPSEEEGDYQIDPKGNTNEIKEKTFSKKTVEKGQLYKNIGKFTTVKEKKTVTSREKIEEKDPLHTLYTMVQESKATPFDLEIFEYMNIARQHPEIIVQKMKKALVSKELSRDYTEEAFKEAIHDMSVKTGVEPLTWDDDIFKACNLHVLDLGNSGKISHKGSDGKTIMDRLNRYGKYHGICGEVIQSGKRSAEEIVLDLIIDFNNKNKQRRRTLMDPRFKHGGVSSGDHKKFGMCTVFGYIG